MIIHASAVAIGGNGLLILGRSGAGKSGLALRLIALGAQLVADDRVLLDTDPEGRLTARAPGPIAGLIEARGVGLLGLEPVAAARIALAVDLDTQPEARLPQDRNITFLECEVRLISGQGVPNIDSILAILLGPGRILSS